MGRSDNDQSHRLVVSGAFRAQDDATHEVLRKALHKLQLDYTYTYASRLPFNVSLGSVRNFDKTTTIAVGVGRNTGQRFDFSSFDLPVSRDFLLG